MADILEFPHQETFDTRKIEQSIAGLLDQTVSDTKAKKALAERLLTIYDKYQRNYDFAFSIKCPANLAAEDAATIENSARENFDRFMEIVHGHMEEILLERFQTEIKLYFLEKQHSH